MTKRPRRTSCVWPARYVNTLRAELPEGPYLLGGWSMGGIVALKMASQLVAAGERGVAGLPRSIVRCPSRTVIRVPPTNRASLMAFAADAFRGSGRETRATLHDLLARDPESIRNGAIDPSFLERELTHEIGPERPAATP